MNNNNQFEYNPEDFPAPRLLARLSKFEEELESAKENFPEYAEYINNLLVYTDNLRVKLER